MPKACAKNKFVPGLLTIICLSSLALPQNLSDRSAPKRHVTGPTALSSNRQDRPRGAMRGRFHGWRNTPPEFPRAHTKPESGRSAIDWGAGSRQIAARARQGAIPSNGFYFRPDLPSGQIPTAVAAGDFNGDGKLDWAVSNGQDNTIWLYFGNGDGTSALPTILPTSGLGPTWLIETDLNGDGKPDLVVAEADSSKIGVFLGKGDGTFHSEVQYRVPAAPLFLVAGDFNGDGNQDIAVGMIGTTASGPVAVLLGDGHGHLESALYEGDPNPSTGAWLEPANLRGNGKLDLIVVDPDDLGPHGGAQVYLNNGDGTFAPGEFVRGNEAVGDLPDAMESAAVAPLTSGGCADLVLVDSFGLAYIFTGNCDGTFVLPAGTQYALGDMGLTVHLVDVNGDGILDMVTSSAYLPWAGGIYGNVAGDQVSVLLGDGAGNFGPPRTYRGDLSMYSLVIGDVNGDGFPDLLTANQGSDTASVFLNDGKGGFGNPQGQGFGNSTGDLNSPVSPFVFGDVDGNGTNDMVIIDNPPYQGSPMQITTFLNNGVGIFSAPVITDAWPASPTLVAGSVTLADFRNTGRPDLLVVGETSSTPVVWFMSNLGGGQFGPYTMTTPAGAAGPIAIGDFNRDGKLDFVTASVSPTDNSQLLSVFLGKGDGTFQSGQVITFEAANPYAVPRFVFAGDFNGDGNLDVMVWDMGLYEFFGNGDGTFQEGIPLFAMLSGGLVMADFNHDGFPDFVTASDESGFETDGSFSVFLGQPGGSFQYAGSLAPYPHFLDGPFIWNLTVLQNQFPGIVGDFNGDGNLDIALYPLLGNFLADPALQILYGNGDGSFTPSYVNYPLTKVEVPELAADLDGDGRTDLVELDNFNTSFNAIHATAQGPSLQIDLLTAPLTGTTGTGRVTLNVPSSTPTQVSFVTSDPGVTAPGVTIPAGAVSQDFAFTIGEGFNALRVFSLEAQGGGATATAYDYVTTPPIAVIETNPPKLVFKGAIVGGPALTLPVTVKNIGAAIFTIDIRQVSTYFSETDDCGDSMAPGATCVIQVTFVPYAPSDVTGSVALGDYSGVTGAAELEGDAASPLQISPCCLGFSELAGGTSPAQTVTLSNLGAIPIQIESVAPSGSGVAQTNNCSTIAVSGSCQINVTFSPAAQGMVIGNLTLNTDVPNMLPFVVPVSGTAENFSLGTAPPVTISSGGSATYNLTATSSGGFTGAVSLTCTAPSGASCSVNPSQIILSTDGTAPYTVTAGTAGSLGGLFALPPENRLRGGFRVPAGAYVLLFAPLLFCGGRRVYGKITARGACVCLGLLLVSCGGGGGGSSGPPPLSYSITVTGTVGSVSHTTTVVLNVQ